MFLSSSAASSSTAGAAGGGAGVAKTKTPRCCERRASLKKKNASSSLVLLRGGRRGKLTRNEAIADRLTESGEDNEQQQRRGKKEETLTLQTNNNSSSSKLAALSTLLERAVVRDLADELANEDAMCSVEYDQEVFEECTNKVTEQLAEVVVLCNSADMASKYSSNLRNKELSRLRGSLWNLRVLLESYCATKGGCSLNVRHRFETLRSAAMEVLPASKRLKKGPEATAIPNLQAVMEPRVKSFEEVMEIAFYRGGQPSVEGRSWLSKNGFTRVVDLRGEDRDNQWVKPFGGGDGQGTFNQNKKFDTTNIPITDMGVPTKEQVEEFIDIANDVLEKNKMKKSGEPKEKMLLHCKAGIGRTGCLVACWRISRGVDVEEALAMEAGLVCDFGCIAQEQFVRDYATDLKHETEVKKFEQAVEKSKFETDAKYRTSYDPVNEYGSMGDVTDVSAMGSNMMGNVSASGEFSSLDQAPDMYLIRTDGFSCTRELVENRELKISHPSTQQMILVWREPPKTIFLLKKIGNALLPQLVEVAHALMTMGMHVILDTDVKRELEDETIKLETVDEQNRTEVRTKALWVEKDSKGKIPKEDWGTIDVCVCLGGDGVILHASKMFQGPTPPVLGFHLGSLGFLTNHPGNDMAPSLLMALGRGPPIANISGGVPITLRMRLLCEVFKFADKVENGGNGEPSFTYTILNEVLVDRGPSPFLSKIEAYDRGQLITSIQADGVMLATATGSTAYSVSAGGSMVHPNVQAILMTPICPHTLSFRPVIFPDSVEVELRVSENARNSAWVSFDGRERCELCRGDSVFVKMSEYPVPTINFENQTGDFISSLRRCLKWNEREEQQVFDASQVAALRMMNENAAKSESSDEWSSR
ncbi:unnamed protein product [Bathycoccus prasinos]